MKGTRSGQTKNYIFVICNVYASYCFAFVLDFPSYILIGLK